MRPVTISPCTGCAMTLEHDQDPRTVLCRSCQRQLDKLIKPPPPEPPPMRNPHQVPTWNWMAFSMAMTVAVCFTVAFSLGWIARGGA